MTVVDKVCSLTKDLSYININRLSDDEILRLDYQLRRLEDFRLLVQTHIKVEIIKQLE